MSPTILIVEDADDDVFFIKRAFRATGLIAQICHVADGRKAIEYLSGAAHYSERAKFPIPCLVLLDIKLPHVSGFEVLRWIREESIHPRLPVVMFTSSNQKSDVERAYELGANAYVVKPTSVDRLSDFADVVKRFWIEMNVPFHSERTSDSSSLATSPRVQDSWWRKNPVDGCLAKISTTLCNPYSVASMLPELAELIGGLSLVS